MYYHTCTAVTCGSRLPYLLTLSVRPHKSIHKSSGYRNPTACGSLGPFPDATLLAHRFQICTHNNSNCRNLSIPSFKRRPLLPFRVTDAPAASTAGEKGKQYLGDALPPYLLVEYFCLVHVIGKQRLNFLLIFFRLNTDADSVFIITKGGTA